MVEMSPLSDALGIASLVLVPLVLSVLLITAFLPSEKRKKLLHSLWRRLII